MERESVHFVRRLGQTLLMLAVMLAANPAFAIPQLLVDMRTGEVLQANEAGRPWHPASLTKLMTAYVTFQAIATGRINLNTPVIMSAHALKAPPSRVGLPLDTALRLEDALYLLIVKSANDVAIAIAETVAGSEAAFVDEMNRTAAELGLTATHYVNPNGLHNAAQVTSARDLAVLSLTIRARYSQYDGLFETGSLTLGEAKLPSHNNLLTDFAGTTGMKTGFVCASGLNIVATVERQGRALMAIVLGGSSARERGELAAEMIVQALTGKLANRSGTSVLDLPNNPSEPPSNMRPLICGTDAKAYVAKRAADFPLGLEGQLSYLTDEVLVPRREITTLGRLRDVPVPRPRPLWAPGPKIAAPVIIPLPRPRPILRGSLRN